MDFFQYQDDSNRKTRRLVALMSLALMVLVLASYAIVILVLTLFEMIRAGEPSAEIDWFRPVVLGIVAVAILAIAAIASLAKYLELREGGARIVERLHGQRIEPGTKDPAERQLLNIVEEMSLAAGIPVPPVFVLKREPSINAFSAGHSAADAVLCVNQGALQHLSRDEMQGMIAHEFSHIFNGDIRLDIKQVSILNGIMFFAEFGHLWLAGGKWIFEALTSAAEESKEGFGCLHTIIFVVLGLPLMIVGFLPFLIGGMCTLLARLIRTAVCRQREYLADASAVQFTRNPAGVIGSLRKIADPTIGSRVSSHDAESFSHMFFSSAVGRSWFAPFATHPPTKRRIRRIDARFADLPQEPARADAGDDTHQQSPAPTREADKQAEAPPLQAAALPASVGESPPAHVTFAHQILAEMPPPLKDALHDPLGARAIVFAMLLNSGGETREKQLQLLRMHEPKAVERKTLEVESLLRTQRRAARLPIVEIIQGTLTVLSPDRYSHFRDVIERLVRAAGQISLFELVLQRLVLNHLDRHVLKKKAPRVRHHSLKHVGTVTVKLISCLAHVGHTDHAAAADAFERAFRQVNLDGATAELLPKNECSVDVLSGALDELACCALQVKKEILAIAIECAIADGRVTGGEAELLRVIGSSLDCPIPPIQVGKAPNPLPET